MLDKILRVFSNRYKHRQALERCAGNPACEDMNAQNLGYRSFAELQELAEKEAAENRLQEEKDAESKRLRAEQLAAEAEAEAAAAKRKAEDKRGYILGIEALYNHRVQTEALNRTLPAVEESIRQELVKTLAARPNMFDAGLEQRVWVLIDQLMKVRVRRELNPEVLAAIDAALAADEKALVALG